MSQYLTMDEKIKNYYYTSILLILDWMSSREIFMQNDTLIVVSNEYIFRSEIFFVTLFFLLIKVKRLKVTGIKILP